MLRHTFERLRKKGSAHESTMQSCDVECCCTTAKNQSQMLKLIFERQPQAIQAASTARNVVELVGLSQYPPAETEFPQRFDSQFYSRIRIRVQSLAAIDLRRDTDTDLLVCPSARQPDMCCTRTSYLLRSRSRSWPSISAGVSLRFLPWFLPRRVVHIPCMRE